MAENALGKKIDGKLVDKEGKYLKSELSKKKYLIFYYAASWWGACGAQTSQLVKWYKKNKSDDFELILVSFDRNQKAMLNYLKKKSVNFPALEMKSSKIASALKGGRYIPHLTMIDENGKKIADAVARKALFIIEKTQILSQFH